MITNDHLKTYSIEAAKAGSIAAGLGAAIGLVKKIGVMKTSLSMGAITGIHHLASRILFHCNQQFAEKHELNVSTKLLGEAGLGALASVAVLTASCAFGILGGSFAAVSFGVSFLVHGGQAGLALYHKASGKDGLWADNTDVNFTTIGRDLLDQVLSPQDTEVEGSS